VPPAPPPSKKSAWLGALAAVVVAVAVVAGGYAWVSKPRDPPVRPAAGDVLLSTKADVPPEGCSFRVRVREPGTLSIATAPSGGALLARFGRAAVPVPGGADLPDAAASSEWTAEPGAAPRAEKVYAAGLYVLRLAPAAPGSKPSASVEIRKTADR
jgi:hypothetical protein